MVNLNLELLYFNFSFLGLELTARFKSIKRMGKWKSYLIPQTLEIDSLERVDTTWLS